MRKRHLPAAAPQRDRWMVSYMDVLTILLIFFLVAAAKSLEAPPTVHAITPAPAVAKSQVTAQPSSLIHAEALLKERGLDPRLEPRGLVLNLSQVILFASGDDAVGAKALPALAQIAEVLRQIPNQVRLIGYADTAPIHNRRFRSNWDLSMARSHIIFELLSGSYGVAESRLSIASYGPYRPAAPNDTVDGRALNRRVEIVILDDSKTPEAD